MKCPHCGRSSDSRSSPQHRRFFKLIEAAFYYWPDNHDFQPHDKEHLRAYLLVEAKHLGILEREGEITERTALEMQAVMRALGKYTRIRPGRDCYFIMYPLSISYGKLKHKEACKVFNDVDEIIRNVIGVQSTDQLLKAYEEVGVAA